MMALWTFQVVAQLSRFALFVSPDLIAASWASALTYVSDVIFLRSRFSLGMRTTRSRGLVGPRCLTGFCGQFGFGLLPNLSVG